MILGTAIVEITILDLVKNHISDSEVLKKLALHRPKHMNTLAPSLFTVIYMVGRTSTFYIVCFA